MSVLDRIRSGEYFYGVLTTINGKVAPIQDGGKAKKELLHLAERGERMRWIPCSEGLPDRHKTYMRKPKICREKG